VQTPNLSWIVCCVSQNATDAINMANARLQLLHQALAAIAAKYETVRSVQGGLVDRLDQCVDALLLAQPR
jgi:hypothetical protein